LMLYTHEFFLELIMSAVLESEPAKPTRQPEGVASWATRQVGETASAAAPRKERGRGTA
jgi:hypothetical protein